MGEDGRKKKRGKPREIHFSVICLIFMCYFGLVPAIFFSSEFTLTMVPSLF